MSQHILALEVENTYNEGIFIVKDLSIYSTTIPVSCPELQILPPGYNIPSVLEVTSGFDLVLNTCTLGMLAAPNCAQSCPILPDGIWWLQYTVAPANLVYVQYNYLRITQAWNRLNKLLCALPLDCTLPDQELQYDIDNISRIREYLIVAQTEVNEKRDPVKGINFYRFAVELMNKMDYKPERC